MHTESPDAEQRRRAASELNRGRNLTAPSILVGIGMGGLFDGVVLHQILQWHHLLSSTARYPPTTVAGLEANTLADGAFHAATLVVLVVGLVTLIGRIGRGISWTWRALLGWALVGWGSFNLVEGIVDHHVLRIHHVRPGPDQLAWDLSFLAIGATLVVVGLVLAHHRPRSD